jgi:putative two-component system response regulator
MQSAESILDLPILAVDDEAINLLLLRRILEEAGYRRVQTETDAIRAVELFLETEPSLVLVDLHMPTMSGFELMERLAPQAGGVPFLMLTADATEETKQRALSSGARDFLTKPFSQPELLLRVRNLLEVQLLHDRLREQNSSLEQKIVERTRDLEHARMEILLRLALAAEYRDDQTQRHARRIGRTCALLARRLGLDQAEVDLIGQAAPLHDVGKIGIPDDVLLKPGKLSESEFAAIKTHTTIGAEILAGSESPLLNLAEQIALTHHERWDGTGYPHQLAGEAIPAAGRLAAIADVFDALTHDRPYKQAWPTDVAVHEVIGQRGRQFDPQVVDAFASLDHRALANRPTVRQPHGQVHTNRSQPHSRPWSSVRSGKSIQPHS